MTAVSYSPSANTHDADEAGGSVDINRSNIQVDGSGKFGGIYVDATTDMAGATINSATLTYYPINTTRDDPDMTWYGEAVDTAAVFASSSNNISNRLSNATAASVYDSATGVGTGQRSIDVTALVAEITARPGWTGPIVLIADGETSANCRFYSYDNGSSAWSLDIDYTAGGGPAHVRPKIGRSRLTTKIGGVLT